MLDDYAHDFVPGTPVLAMLHGTGGDRASFGAFAAELAPGAGVLSLDGDVMEGPMRRFFRRRAEGVYDMDDLARRTARLGGFLTAAAGAYGFEAAGTVGVGYSNGANILANLLFVGGFRPGRAVLMHPLIPFAPDPGPSLEGMDVLVTAGRRDPICPWRLTESLVAALEARGAAVTLAAHDGGHEVRPEEVAAIRRFLG
jgi:phospholipase/carboxylesterase